MGAQQPPRISPAALIGKAFVHPVFDYLLIGGGLSLIVIGVVLANPARGSIVAPALLPWFMLFSNNAHFASSTVRLYTKPGASQALPFLTVSLGFAGSIGPHLQSLYLTWSPFHYAAQAYGLAVMYAYRSGCQLHFADKKLLWWCSLPPFFYAFVSDQQAGLQWLMSSSVLGTPWEHFWADSAVRRRPASSSRNWCNSGPTTRWGITFWAAPIWRQETSDWQSLVS